MTEAERAELRRMIDAKRRERIAGGPPCPIGFGDDEGYKHGCRCTRCIRGIRRVRMRQYREKLAA